ncbi:hypothetical protein BDW71DRAFT_89814 [Aspergillus fruticulosus]
MYNRNYSRSPQADCGHDMVSSTPRSTTRGSDSGNQHPDQLQAIGVNHMQLQTQLKPSAPRIYPRDPRAEFGHGTDAIIPRRDFRHGMGLPTPTTPTWVIEEEGNLRRDQLREINQHPLQRQLQPQFQSQTSFSGLVHLRIDILQALTVAIVQSLGAKAFASECEWSTETAPCPLPTAGPRIPAAAMTAANGPQVGAQIDNTNKQPNDCFIPPDRVKRLYHPYRGFALFPTLVILTDASDANANANCLSVSGHSNQDLQRDAHSWFAASEGATRIVLMHTYNAHTHTLTIEKWQLAFPGTTVPATQTEWSMNTQAPPPMPPLGLQTMAFQRPYCSQRMVLTEAGLMGGPLYVHFHALMDRAPVAQLGETDMVLHWEALRDVARKL